MREAGFNPNTMVDAPHRIGVIDVVIEMQDMKDAMIGNLEHCSGSNCLRRNLHSILANGNVHGELFVAIAASRAFVAWRSEKGKETAFRFLINGLPVDQDRTMNVVGEHLTLRPPNGASRTTGKTQGAKKKPRQARYTAKSDVGRNSRTRSLAAQLRAM